MDCHDLVQKKQLKIKWMESEFAKEKGNTEANVLQRDNEVQYNSQADG